MQGSAQAHDCVLGRKVLTAEVWEATALAAAFATAGYANMVSRGTGWQTIP